MLNYWEPFSFSVALLLEEGSRFIRFLQCLTLKQAILLLKEVVPKRHRAFAGVADQTGHGHTLAFEQF
jgi:hypothetical protein